MKYLSRNVVVVRCLAIADCSPSSPTPFLPYTPGPAPTVYTGSIEDSINGNGTLMVSLGSAQGLTSGTWEMSLGGKADKHFITGTVSGGVYTATFEPCPPTGTTTCGPECVMAFAGPLTASSLSGTYKDVPNRLCPARAGSVSAAR